jgi:uroporphyrin-III C-methyltransferase
VQNIIASQLKSVGFHEMMANSLTTPDYVKLSEDLKIAAQTNATIVILMGYKKLAQIVTTYQQIDKGNIPIAVIQNGSFEDERIAIGTINTIEEDIIKNKLGTPAIIVVGEVVKLHPSLIKKVVEENISHQ